MIQIHSTTHYQSCKSFEQASRAACVSYLPDVNQNLYDHIHTVNIHNILVLSIHSCNSF